MNRGRHCILRFCSVLSSVPSVPSVSSVPSVPSVPSATASLLDCGGHKSPFSSSKQRENQWSRKQRRAYHRVLSGLEVARAFNERVRFITLTSSPSSPEDIHSSFSKLVKRIRRLYGKFEYFAVREETSSGLIHVHLLYRGSYIPRDWLSSVWAEIHKAPIVWIREVDLKRDSKKKIAGYLVKYLAKNLLGRFWASWNWVFRGFVKFWKMIIEHYGYGSAVIAMWREFLWGNSVILDHVFVNGKLVRLRQISLT